jgi:hypothetical protein
MLPGFPICISARGTGTCVPIYYTYGPGIRFTTTHIPLRVPPLYAYLGEQAFRTGKALLADLLCLIGFANKFQVVRAASCGMMLARVRGFALPALFIRCWPLLSYSYDENADEGVGTLRPRSGD